MILRIKVSDADTLHLVDVLDEHNSSHNPWADREITTDLVSLATLAKFIV